MVIYKVDRVHIFELVLDIFRRCVMYIKYIALLFIFVFLSGCGAYPYGYRPYNAYVYQKYANSQEVKRAYREEQKKITVEEKSTAKCVARNIARMRQGLPPWFPCGNTLYPYYYGGGYGGGYYGWH